MTATTLPTARASAFRRGAGPGIAWFTLTLLTVLAFAAPSHAASPNTDRHAPVIAFLTDYGTLDDAVAICKGVMLTIAPEVRVIDITHQVTPYSIADGARYLSRASLYFPPGTIFVGVVDPGVGTRRHPIIVKSKRGQYFVVPDNGLATLALDRDGIEGAREITNPAWMLGTISSTFHGRDIFAPAAAHIARGDDWTSAGPVLAQPVRLAIQPASLDAAGIKGRVVSLDGPFGNLITNVSADHFQSLGYRIGEKVHIEVGGTEFTVPYVKTFGDVPEGQPLLYIDSSGLLSIAINQGNFAATHHITPPTTLIVPKK